MPSTVVISVRMVLLSSTVITPSLPTVSMASEISLPMVSSPAEMLATCAMDCLPVMGWLSLARASTAAFTPASMPRLSTMGLAPAARLRRPSRMMA